MSATRVEAWRRQGPVTPFPDWVHKLRSTLARLSSIPGVDLLGRAAFRAWAKLAALCLLWWSRGRIVAVFARGSFGSEQFRAVTSDLDLVCIWRPRSGTHPHREVMVANRALSRVRKIEPFVRDTWQLMIAEDDLPLARRFWSSLGEAPEWCLLARTVRIDAFALPPAPTKLLVAALIDARAMRLQEALGAATRGDSRTAAMHGKKGAFYAAVIERLLDTPEDYIDAKKYRALLSAARRRSFGAQRMAVLEFDRLVGKWLDRYPDAAEPSLKVAAPLGVVDSEEARERLSDLITRHLPRGVVRGVTSAGALHVVVERSAIGDESVFAGAAALGKACGAHAIVHTESTYRANAFRSYRRFMFWDHDGVLSMLGLPPFHARAQMFHMTLGTILEYFVATQRQVDVSRFLATWRVLLRGKALIDHDALCPTAVSAIKISGLDEPTTADEPSLFGACKRISDSMRPGLLSYADRFWGNAQ